MSTGWLSQRERGSRFLLLLFTGSVRLLGRTIGRLLLYPIVFYFVLLAATPRRASAVYLEQVLGRPARFADIFRHFYCFASVALDRVFLLTGRYRQLDVSVHNPEALLKYMDQGQPCILLGGHFGSFEVMRVLGGDRGLAISILMYEENATKIRDVINLLNPELAQRVIPIGEAQTLIKVQEAADRGDLIGILGDRVRAGDKQVRCQFLGREASFPAGPLMLAGVLKLPVVFGAAIFHGGNRYEIFFEPLFEQLHLPRERRQEALQEHVQAYVSRLEHYCRKSPYNWFNFYNVWERHSDD